MDSTLILMKEFPNGFRMFKCVESIKKNVDVFDFYGYDGRIIRLKCNSMNGNAEYIKPEECVWCESEDTQFMYVKSEFKHKGVLYPDAPMYYTQCNSCDNQGFVNHEQAVMREDWIVKNTPCRFK